MTLPAKVSGHLHISENVLCSKVDTSHANKGKTGGFLLLDDGKRREMKSEEPKSESRQST